MTDIMKLIGRNEVLPVTNHHDVYPVIDPQPHFQAQTFKGKVVFVTGASRGIGRETALHFARAGAHVAISARVQTTLDETKSIILAEVPSADVLVLPVDVKSSSDAEAAIRATVERYGRLDVLIANAGAANPFNQLLGEQDADKWWDIMEVNLRGVFNFVRAALPSLQKTNGYIFAISSVGAQLRHPRASDYSISKFAVNRLVEYIALEYPQVKAFSLHPGGIETQIVADAQLVLPIFDTLQLPACTMLYLASGKADWLNGRYISSTWDLGEVERDWKSWILENNGLVNTLVTPARLSDPTSGAN
ncbi:NAD-P-binding protein [Gloeopeniophorella convolvens]|nr:NAD-P-binding protein [Gloeopeniophorella convolvens]